MGPAKWQTVDFDACVVWKQEGFLCESDTIKAKTFVLTLNQMFVILKYIPMKPMKLYLYILEMDVFAWELYVILYV